MLNPFVIIYTWFSSKSIIPTFVHKSINGFGRVSKLTVAICLFSITCIYTYKVNCIPERFHKFITYTNMDVDSIGLNVNLNFFENYDSITLSNSNGNCDNFSFKYKIRQTGKKVLEYKSYKGIPTLFLPPPTTLHLGHYFMGKKIKDNRLFLCLPDSFLKGDYKIGQLQIFDLYKLKGPNWPHEFEDILSTHLSSIYRHIHVFKGLNFRDTVKSKINIDSIFGLLFVEHLYNGEIRFNDSMTYAYDFLNNVHVLYGGTNKGKIVEDQKNRISYTRSIVLLSSQNEDTIKTFEVYQSLKRSTLQKWIAAYDISQSYFDIDLTGIFDNVDKRNSLSNSSLKLTFGSAITPSGINIEPDKYYYNGFEYTDINKLTGDFHIRFYIKHAEFENLQIFRNFVLTTLLGLLLTFICKEFWVIIIVHSRKELIKRKRVK